MSDLVTDLRRHEREYPSLVHAPLCGRAADEIVRLRSELVSAQTEAKRWKQGYDEMKGLAAIAITKCSLSDEIGK